MVDGALRSSPLPCESDIKAVLFEELFCPKCCLFFFFRAYFFFIRPDFPGLVPPKYVNAIYVTTVGEFSRVVENSQIVTERLRILIPNSQNRKMCKN